MVDVVCSPPKQLIILECTRYPTLEALAKVIAVVISSGESVILKWAEGVAFMYFMNRFWSLACSSCFSGFTTHVPTSNIVVFSPPFD